MKKILFLFAAALAIAGCAQKEVDVTSVTITPPSIELTEGQGITSLTAKVLPETAVAQVSWSSSDATVASVNQSGGVTPLKAGTATITATAGGKSGSCKVTVNSKIIAVTGVSLDKSELSITKGGTSTLKASVAPDNATNKNVRWKSSDATIASVDNSGKVTAVEVGEATITVTTEDGNKTATCKVTVGAIQASSVSISPSTVSVKELETLQLTATVLPEDAADKEVEWGVFNTDIATIDKTSGLLTGVKAGTTKVTVRLKNNTGITATCDVTVIADKSVKSIKLSAEELFVKVSKTAQLTVYFTPEDADNKEVTWSSDKASVAKVENGKVTGVAVGTATITATSKDGGHKASCKVTVTANEPDLYVCTDKSLLRNGEKIYKISREHFAIDHSNGDVYYHADWDLYKNGEQFWSRPSQLYISRILASSGNVHCVMEQSGSYMLSLYNAKTQEKMSDLSATANLTYRYHYAASLSPDGNKIGIVTRGENAFGEAVGILSIYDMKSGNLKETTINVQYPNTGRGCAFDNDGNFYYSVHSSVGSSPINIYKNDQVLYSIKNSDYAWDGNMYVPIVVSGKDIYFAFSYGSDNSTIAVFKNGSHQYDIKADSWDSAIKMRVSSKGNIYIGTHTEIFRDGKSVYKFILPAGSIHEQIEDFDIYE